MRGIIGVYALAFIAGLNADKFIAKIEIHRSGIFLLIVGQLRRDVRDTLALVACAVELVGARLARTIGFSQCGGAVGRAARDLVHVGQCGEGVGQAERLGIGDRQNPRDAQGSCSSSAQIIL